MKGWLGLQLLIAVLIWSGAANAHQPSDSYLTIRVADAGGLLSGSWDIHVRDLEHVVGIDQDGDGAITWGELKSKEASISAYALAHLRITTGAPRSNACPVVADNLLVDRHTDGAYAVLTFTALCSTQPDDLEIHYTLLFADDPDHRGLLNLVYAGKAQAAVFSVANDQQSFSLAAPGAWQQFRSFVGEGVWHILHGYDHILFLVTLILPAVLLYRLGRWTPRPTLRGTLMDIGLIASMFTLAHSFTLSLAALEVVRLPGQWVESAIALTVLLGALNNLFPVVTSRRWIMAFVFGLIHGFGFASVLGDLGLGGANRLLALVGFNIGVEIGQLAVILVLVPAIYPLRAHWIYRRVVMPTTAIAIGGLAIYWFADRAGLTGLVDLSLA